MQRTEDDRWRRAAVLLSVTCALVAFGFAYARYATFHNRTFDLGFYARMAWGLARLGHWDPILNTSVLGLHLSPILVPLGMLGLVLGVAPVLLAAQSISIGAAALTLGRLGARHIGPSGWVLGTAALLLHPNVGHTATFEAHPGTIALWPLAYAIERFDARDARGLVRGVLGVLVCREDLALMTAAIGVLAFREPALRTTAGRVVGGSIAYLAIFVLVLHPMFAPAAGSLEAHFGIWGDSPREIVWTWLSSPLRVAAHLLAPHRLGYLASLLLPLALLPLLAFRWWLPVLPGLAINLMSAFPTAADVTEHYSTTILPPLVAAALEGLSRAPSAARVALAASLAAGVAVLGVSPLSPEFRADARSESARRMVTAIESIDRAAQRSVQVPDALLPHVAERKSVFRAPPPDRNADLVVLDASIRAVWLHSGTVMRTSEEPLLRNWLSRPDYGVVSLEPPYVLLARGADPRAGPLRRYFEGRGDEALRGERLTECLRLREVTRVARGVSLLLEARGECPADLALRIDSEMATTRTDLLFDGWLSPAWLRAGDLVRSEHEIADLGAAIFLGAVRSSGARPAPDDPPWIRVQLPSGP